MAAKSGFGPSTSAEDVTIHYATNLTGKTAIVTGANTGLGKETAKILAKANATVYMACRDLAKCQLALEEIQQQVGKEKLIAAELDLGSLESIRNFAQDFNSKNIPLNILINNAGVMACPKGHTKDGFDLQMGINHFGHFLLTNLLLPSLKRGAPSRVVNVSSRAHNRGNLIFDDLNSEKSYSKWVAYGNSKLANILFAKEYNRIFSGEGITAYSLHPGVIPTELSRHLGIIGSIFKVVGGLFLKNLGQGSATTVYCAVAPDLEKQGGSYFADCDLFQSNHTQITDENAKKLWEISEKAVGLNN